MGVQRRGEDQLVRTDVGAGDLLARRHRRAVIDQRAQGRQRHDRHARQRVARIDIGEVEVGGGESVDPVLGRGDRFVRRRGGGLRPGLRAERQARKHEEGCATDEPRHARGQGGTKARDSPGQAAPIEAGPTTPSRRTPLRPHKRADFRNRPALGRAVRSVRRGGIVHFNVSCWVSCRVSCRRTARLVRIAKVGPAALRGPRCRPLERVSVRPPADRTIPATARASRAGAPATPSPPCASAHSPSITIAINHVRRDISVR